MNRNTRKLDDLGSTSQQLPPQHGGSIAPGAVHLVHEAHDRNTESTQRSAEPQSRISVLAGKRVPQASLVNIAKLVTAYYCEVPDPTIASQRVAFGTSGHRGSAFTCSFNQWHVQAITQAICNYRKHHGINGPLFLGIDTHALSEPAYVSALEVLAANGVTVMLATHNEYTPTPAISHAILAYNRGRKSGWADGIVVTPSHNPPDDGGLKYNPPNGGSADERITRWVEAAANIFLESNLDGVKQISYARAVRAATTHRYNFINAYVSDLGSVIDIAAIRDGPLHMGVDPMGGAGVHYWAAIADRYRLDLKVISDAVDLTFSFMTLDWDGQIRMDPSSKYAMRRRVEHKDRFDISFACDTDHDRHGIVTSRAGLMAPNHYLSVAIDYLFQHRAGWNAGAAVGKTVVSTQLIDRVATRLGRSLFETPAAFKWFADALHTGALGFAGEESAGATFQRRDGTVWTTDKDGIVASLLAAEITSCTGRDPGALYVRLAEDFGNPVMDRVEAPATPTQKKQLAALSAQQIQSTELAGEKIESIVTHAPGNGASIGGIKVTTKNGWFAARPSGTEALYKIYAESFSSPPHLRRILEEAQYIVDAAIS